MSMNINILKPQILIELGSRGNQEDSVYPKQNEASKSDRLFILCDGMGGHEDGEVASHLVCNTLSTYLKSHWNGDVLSDNILDEAIDEVFYRINEYDSDSLKKMGTTLTLLCLHAGGVTMAHIGDSRIYHIRPSEHRILYKSRDHSLAYDLFFAGEISMEEIEDYKKSVITRAIIPGLEKRPKADIVHTTDILPDDYFMLCSDGMLEQMKDDELLDILCKDTSNEQKRKILIEKTVNNKDNHSAILVQLSDIVQTSNDASNLHDENISRSNAIVLAKEQEAEQTLSDSIRKSPNKMKSAINNIKKVFL